MRELKVTGTLWVEDNEVDENDSTGLTERAFGDYIIPLMNQGLEDVETSLA